MINTILVEDDLYIQKHFVDRLALQAASFILSAFSVTPLKRKSIATPP